MKTGAGELPPPAATRLKRRPSFHAANLHIIYIYSKWIGAKGKNIRPIGKKFPAAYWDHSGENPKTKVGQVCAMAAAMADRMVQIRFIIFDHLLRLSWLMT